MKLQSVVQLTHTCSGKLRPGTTQAPVRPLLVPPQKGQWMIYAPVLWVRWELFVLWGSWRIETWNMKMKFCSWIDLQGWAGIKLPDREQLDKYNTLCLSQSNVLEFALSHHFKENERGSQHLQSCVPCLWSPLGKDIKKSACLHIFVWLSAHTLLHVSIWCQHQSWHDSALCLRHVFFNMAAHWGETQMGFDFLMVLDGHGWCYSSWQAAPYLARSHPTCMLFFMRIWISLSMIN